MGKSLKGKDCGKSICQGKDGTYSARFITKRGKRLEKHFDGLPQARNWLEDAKYADKHDEFPTTADMTADEWFNFWIDELISDLAPNTKRNYRERYVQNVQPAIGRMKLAAVKPVHCKAILNRTGEPAKTVPMIPIYISFAKKLELSTSVCTRSGTPMPQGP